MSILMLTDLLFGSNLRITNSDKKARNAKAEAMQYIRIILAPIMRTDHSLGNSNINDTQMTAS